MRQKKMGNGTIGRARRQRTAPYATTNAPQNFSNTPDGYRI